MRAPPVSLCTPVPFVAIPFSLGIFFSLRRLCRCGPSCFPSFSFSFLSAAFSGENSTYNCSRRLWRCDFVSHSIPCILSDSLCSVILLRQSLSFFGGSVSHPANGDSASFHTLPARPRIFSQLASSRNRSRFRKPLSAELSLVRFLITPTFTVS